MDSVPRGLYFCTEGSTDGLGLAALAQAVSSRPHNPTAGLSGELALCIARKYHLIPPSAPHLAVHRSQLFSSGL